MRRCVMVVMLATVVSRGVWAEQPSMPEPVGAETAPIAPTPEATRPPPTPAKAAATLPEVIPEETKPAAPAGLSATWGQSDHISGIYHAKDPAKLAVYFENSGAKPLELSGTIEFGLTPAGGETFKAVAITPLEATNVAPGKRVKVPLEVTFAAAGTYELQWVHGDQRTAIGNAGTGLRCIFAPRVPASAQTPWITPLPRGAAAHAGMIADVIAQTSVRHFLVDERFGFDEATGIGLAGGASLDAPPARIDALFKEIAAAKATVAWRLTIPAGATADERTLTALRRYFADLIPRTHESLRYIAVAPDPLATAEQRATFSAFYLAAYEAIKKADKTILLLGAGDAGSTRDLLVLHTPTLRRYLDAVAITDAGMQAAIGQGLATDPENKNRLPIVVLPPVTPESWQLVPPAAGLAAGATLVAVPPPEVDRGVAAHLLGGTVLFQQLHPESLPYVAVFQGDGYAVAAVAGPGANTQLDGAFSHLAASRTIVTPARDDKHPFPHLEVSDDANSLRVVDAAGAPIDVRTGDTLYVPVGDKVVYIISGGAAEDLASVLLPAQPRRLPSFEVAAAMKEGSLAVQLKNMAAKELAGEFSVIEPSAESPEQSTVLTSGEFAALAPGHVAEMTLALPRMPKAKAPLIVELRCRDFVQRTAIVLPE